MTEASQPTDSTAAMLDLLEEMDLSAAQHVHAKLLAAEAPRDVAELARAYQRASRGVRQVLMLKMKHQTAQAEAAVRAARPPELGLTASTEARSRMADLRAGQLQDAVGRVASAAWPDKPRLQREALDRLDVLINDWILDEDGEGETLFHNSLDDLVLDACEELKLPADLARRWETLPKPPHTFDPAEAQAPAIPPQITDTG